MNANWVNSKDSEWRSSAFTEVWFSVRPKYTLWGSPGGRLGIKSATRSSQTLSHTHVTHLYLTHMHALIPLTHLHLATIPFPKNNNKNHQANAVFLYCEFTSDSSRLRVGALTFSERAPMADIYLCFQICSVYCSIYWSNASCYAWEMCNSSTSVRSTIARYKCVRCINHLIAIREFTCLLTISFHIYLLSRIRWLIHNWHDAVHLEISDLYSMCLRTAVWAYY